MMISQVTNINNENKKYKTTEKRRESNRRAVKKYQMSDKCKHKGGKCKWSKEKKAVYAFNWYKENFMKVRGGYVERKYGITQEWYELKFKEQNGVCAICGGINKNKKRLSIDHNHKTGKIRGLLCIRCNWTLGLVDEDYDRLTEIANYLKEYDDDNIS